MEARRASFVGTQSATRLRMAHEPEEGGLQPRIQPHDGWAWEGLRDHLCGSGWDHDRDGHANHSRRAVTRRSIVGRQC